MGRRARPPDLRDLAGQPYLRRALEVAAAGGSQPADHRSTRGGQVACRAAAALDPSVTGRRGGARGAADRECLRAAAQRGRPAKRPFRAPHHTISAAGLVGGGSPPRAGEVTLAHGGVLFLDELGEFSRDALEALRQPLEEGRVVLTRVRHTVELPCRFMLVAAANPCPCGHGADDPKCDCSPVSIRRYRAKLSGALADRIDLVLAVDRPSAEEMGGPSGECSAIVRERVMAARERQEHRLGAGRTNADMSAAETRTHAGLGNEGKLMLARGHERLALSGRGYDRVLRVARTIADLAGCDRVDTDHVRQALGLRRRGDD